MQPLLLALLAGQGDLGKNPLMLVLLLQGMQGLNVGSLGGQPLRVDIGQILVLGMLFRTFGQSTAPATTPATTRN
jgi:hypothetical protein